MCLQVHGLLGWSMGAAGIALHVVCIDVEWGGGFKAGRRGSFKGTWIGLVLFLFVIGGTVHAICFWNCALGQKSRQGARAGHCITTRL